MGTRTSPNTGYSDADAFPVDQSGTTLIGFSSTRPQVNTGSQGNNNGGYILYLGDTTIGAVYYLPNLDPNTKSSVPLSALGGTYTPYTHARKLAVAPLAQGTTLSAGETVTIQVYAWSDGGSWSGALPKVVLTGPNNTQTAPVQLEDTGMVGTGPTANYEIYSASMTIPSAPGAYTISTTADSAENGLTNVISSGSLAVTVAADVPTTPRWMLGLLAVSLCLVASHVLRTSRV